MENNQSLDKIAKQESKWERIGKRALSELKLLPYEAVGALAGGYGGYKGGEFISQNFFPITPDRFFLNLGQDLQDTVFAAIGGMIITLPATYAARRIGKYVNEKFKDLTQYYKNHASNQV